MGILLGSKTYNRPVKANSWLSRVFKLRDRRYKVASAYPSAEETRCDGNFARHNEKASAGTYVPDAIAVLS